MKQTKRILSLVLALALIISLLPTYGVSAASKKVKLNKTKATIYVGKTVKLKVKNTKKKVKMILEEYQKYNKLTDYELEQFPLFFDIANAMGILQISHLNTLGELSEEDKFWYDESEKGLEFSNEEFWKDIYVKNDAKDNL